jgi:hypothetical protein
VSTINRNLLLLSKEIIGIVCQIEELANVTPDSTATNVLVGHEGAYMLSHTCVYLRIKMPQGAHTRRLQGTGTTGVDSASVKYWTSTVAVKWELARRCSRTVLRKTAAAGSGWVPWYCGL